MVSTTAIRNSGSILSRLLKCESLVVFEFNNGVDDRYKEVWVQFYPVSTSVNPLLASIQVCSVCFINDGLLSPFRR